MKKCPREKSDLDKDITIDDLAYALKNCKKKKKCPNNSWNFIKIHETSSWKMKVHEDSPLLLKVTECAWTSRLGTGPSIIIISCFS